MNISTHTHVNIWPVKWNIKLEISEKKMQICVESAAASLLLM